MPLEWLMLNSVKGLGPVRIKKLLEVYHEPRNVFSSTSAELTCTGIVPPSCVAQLHSASLKDSAAGQLELCKQTGCRIITLADTDYPQYLREIYAPPPVLFVKGDLNVFKAHAVAIVGTRVPTVYGRTVTASLTHELGESGLVIVSGLARGIDTIAHETCCDHKTLTIAVLGCGIDIVYPSSNKALAERILENGAIISEFPPGTKPEAYNFPRRNRIISGLSAGTIVIEAGERSGSLITAHYALQQNRELFAVPGPVTSSLSNGTFNLLKQGAIPVRCAKDILDEIQMVKNPSLFSNTLNSPLIKMPVDLLSDDELDIMKGICEQPRRIDEIAEVTGRTIADLFNILLNLELKNVIRQISGQSYVKV